jgi:hypothetical protein
MLTSALLGLLLAASATADTSTGDRLLVACEKYESLRGRARTEDMADAMFCVGFVSGVADTVNMLSRASGAGVPVAPLSFEGRKFAVCFPENVTYDQDVHVVLNFLRDHPAVRHSHRAALAFQALADAFPCPHAPPAK